MSNPRQRLACFTMALYLFVTATIIGVVWHSNDGHFTYSLDDPYIHLALAEQLAHGHYGINATEAASPASSALWPFLLIPLAGTTAHVYLPLACNLLFGCLAAWLIGEMLAEWPGNKERTARAWRWPEMAWAALLILIANLPGLALVGMEHGLQVMLAVACAAGMLRAFRGQPIPLWSIAAAIFAPAVRYEDITLTLAVCITLAGLGKWLRAAAVFAMSLLPLAAFSGYLHSKGLPLLPISVLMKADTYHKAGATAAKPPNFILARLHTNLTDPTRLPCLTLVLVLAFLAARAKTRIRRHVLWGAASVGALQLTVGRFGFHRYETYAIILMALICLHVLAEEAIAGITPFVLGLVCCWGTMLATLRIPASSTNVYLQQYQMRRFVTEFYHGNYAVNDLGLMSFQRDPNAFVLDLWGLGSVEAAHHPDKSPAWLANVTARYQVRLAVVYPDWFQIPASWVDVGHLCIKESVPITSIAGRCVTFYSTMPGNEAVIRTDLRQFAGTLPARDEYVETITARSHLPGIILPLKSTGEPAKVLDRAHSHPGFLSKANRSIPARGG